MGGPGKIGLKHPIIDKTKRIKDIIIQYGIRLKGSSIDTIT